MRFTFHTDPGHGWLQVSRADLAALSLTPGDFSPYSYWDPDSDLFFLEEDCDAFKFDKAWRQANPGLRLPTNGAYWDTDHPLRRLPSISEAA